jgi:putative flippase GtrA
MIKSLYNKLPDRLFAFLCVGVVGFAVDAVILQTLIFDFGWDYYRSRLASFAIAVLCTWLLNRIWTFKDKATDNRTREYSIYLIIQSIGASLNFAIYSACIFVNDIFLSYPIAALAIGSICAMFFNFAAMRRFAFTGSKTGDRAK